jgi:hypothetical protein
MSDDGFRGSEKYSEKNEEIDCPYCKKVKIGVTYIPGYKSWTKSSIAAGSKLTAYYHDPKYKVESKCPSCGKSAKEIKEALENGGKPPKTLEERLKRLQACGLPMKFGSSKS